jgi:protease I
MKRMRKIVFSIVISLFVLGCGSKKGSATGTNYTTEINLSALLSESIPPITDTAKIKRFVMLVAPRAFRDEELKIPYELLTKIGHKITVASRDTVIAIGVLGLAVKPQITVKDIDTLKYDGLILVGGTGAAIYWDDSVVHQFARYFARTPNKIVAAICLAPVTLARAGVLAGKKATVYEDKSTIADLTKGGAQYEKTDVVISGNIITASGPQAAEKFAKAIALSVR